MSVARCCLLLLSLLASGCGAATPATVRYTGQSPACGRSEGGGTTATLTRLGRGFAFAPYDGVLVVRGTVAPDGSLAGTLALRPMRAGAPGTKSPAAAQAISVTGRIGGEAATLAYAAPGCTTTLTLARAHPPLL